MRRRALFTLLANIANTSLFADARADFNIYIRLHFFAAQTRHEMRGGVIDFTSSTFATIRRLSRFIGDASLQ